jgi:hypothetical protein
MLAASFGRLYAGVDHGLARTLMRALSGLMLIVLVRKSLQRDQHPAVFAGMSNVDARKVYDGSPCQTSPPIAGKRSRRCSSPRRSRRRPTGCPKRYAE